MMSAAAAAVECALPALVRSIAAARTWLLAHKVDEAVGNNSVAPRTFGSRPPAPFARCRLTNFDFLPSKTSSRQNDYCPSPGGDR